MLFNQKNSKFIVMVLSFIFMGVSLLFLAVNSVLMAGSEYISCDFLSEIKEDQKNKMDECLEFKQRVDWIRKKIIVYALFGTIISFFAGMCSYSSLKKKDKNLLTKKIINTLTTPDEKLLLRALESVGGELTQSALVKKTKLSKVKVHRIVKRLESLNMIDKYSYGVTNMIKLNENIEEKKN